MRDQLSDAVRGLRHRRGVAATVVLTLTLGIGANSAIFSAVDAVLLAEAARREHEVAVRFALGASRMTVARQLLAEGLILSLIGSVLGLVVANWGTALATS